MSAFSQITGRLGQDPDLRYTNGGTPVVNLSVASNRQKKNGDGEKVSVADWYRITVFGRDAEILAQYAKKGSALAFNGRLQTDSYVDREGQQRTSTYLIADSFEFVPTAKRAEENGDGNGETHAAPEETNIEAPESPEETADGGKSKRRTKRKTIPEDEIPF
ncbi:MAG: Single-stranded DNA-binding protein [Gammaproteobacteria bacterium]|nr:Single-stranded DNA-binding protein [Gammaproteobacteria bacterium]